jgi:ABC-type branched-subunit amino acid transport system ATPase component
LSGGDGPILRVQGLVRRFGGVRAVDDASFDVERGTITGLIGPNGAGKSTVLNMIGGFLSPDAGRIVFDGRDVTGWPMHRLARAGVVRTFQMARVFGGLTALENLMVAAPEQRGETALGVLAGGLYWGAQERKLVDDSRSLMRSFGMEAKADELARNLSGGQRRATETMRALTARPKLLLLDEPMAGLSPSLSAQLEKLFTELAAGGISLLLVEHELDTIDRLCSKVVVMAQGKVLAEGRMSDLRTRKEVQDAYVIG